MSIIADIEKSTKVIYWVENVKVFYEKNKWSKWRGLLSKSASAPSNLG